MNEKEKIESLRKELEQHNYNYYVLSSPTISDQEYDAKLKELQLLEQNNPNLFSQSSPTQHVGSDINPQSRNFEQRYHSFPMLSLSNTYSREEVQEWYSKLPANTEIVCELKYDGLGISLHYEKGILQYALTRGDGQKGDNVLENIKTIPTIPFKIPYTSEIPKIFEIRGEILLPWENFDKLNAEREEIGEPLFANPRNAASGTLKLLDTEEVKHRGLTSFLYYLLGDNLPYKTHFECMQQAKKWGFPISDAITRCHNVDEIMNFINLWDTKRHSFPVAIDGIVLKVNNLALQQQIGYTAKTPKWAIAYKYKPEQQITMLKKISYQVGRTGVITPVGELNPIQLSGTTVRRATLHNENFIRQLNLHEGDTVAVEKGGEIIPKITAVIKTNNNNILPYTFPTHCPYCGTPLVKQEKEVAWYCPNYFSCPPQQIFKMVHYVSRKAMNIDGMGYETIKLLFNKNLVHNITDIYHLKITDLKLLEGFGEKSASKLLNSIEESKNRKWENVLFALGIRMVGETMAKKIAKKYPSIDKLRFATKEELTRVDDIGEQVANNIITYLNDTRNLQIIKHLQDIGLQFESQDSMTTISSSLAGEKIIISGVFKYHSRDQYKTIIEQNGGINVTSISKNTTKVLAGENMGDAKRKKAVELHIPIIGEEEFLRLIKNKE